MLEAGWLLLLLFLGLCSLIAVAVLWPSFSLSTAALRRRKAPVSPEANQTETTARSMKTYVKEWLRYIGWWIACLAEEQMGDQDALYLTFSAEEVGKIAVLIIKKVERKQAIRSMPRYEHKQRKVFAQFYDDLKAVLEADLKDNDASA